MSVQSVKNGILQLAELVISNEKYTDATGYVASSSTFSSSKNSTSLAVDGSVSAHSFSTTAGGTSLFDNITVIDTLTIGAAPVELTGTAGELMVAGNVSASTFNTTAAGTSTFDNITSVGTVAATLLTAQTGDLYVGGESTFARTSNLGSTTFVPSSNGLYIGRNVTNGQNEFDIVAVNSTSEVALNIYSAQDTNITSTTIPTISIATGAITCNSTLDMNGNQIINTGNVSAATFSTTAAGTSTFDDITAVGSVSAGSISAVTFSTTAAGTSTFDDINAVGSVSAGSISAVTFSTTAAGTSTFDNINAVGSISAPTFSGGIGGVRTQATILAGTAQYSIHALNNVTITNFVGSETNTAYTMTSNTVGQPSAFGCSVFFSSTDGTNTIVEPYYTYLGLPPSIDQGITFAITAVNF